MEHTRDAPTAARERTLALVLAGGKGSRLQELTDNCAKPAVPFGGHYRIVDFTLSNCVNSGIRDIALLTQYKSQPLIRHINRSWLTGSGASIEIWPAQQRLGDRWYAGTADAVRQNADLIAEAGPAHVLVAAGDHVYAMNYGPMIDAHIARGADATVCCTEFPVTEAHALGIVEVDDQMRLRSFVEKPARPVARPGSPAVVLASMGIYVFETAFLLECLERDARDRGSRHDFGYSILPRLAARADIYAHVFGDAGDGTGYWRDVGTLDNYWNAHMDLLSEAPQLDPNDARWPIRPEAPQTGPTTCTATADVRASILAGGSRIAGQVVNSVVSTGCTIGAGSTVSRSVLLPNVTIGRNCLVDSAVIASGCCIPDDAIVAGHTDEGRADRALLVSDPRALPSLERIYEDIA